MQAKAAAEAASRTSAADTDEAGMESVREPLALAAGEGGGGGGVTC